MVHLEEQSNLIGKLVFRLVKKHIAGSTSGSVLNVVRELNNKGLHTTVTLLNDHVDDAAKAKYNTNAYIHFIRQLSRLHLNSDVSIRPSQIGHGMEASLLDKNLQSIVEVANSCDQRLWIEDEKELGEGGAMPIYRKFKPKCSTLGVEMMPETRHLDNGVFGKVASRDIIKLRHRVRRSEERQGEKDKEKKSDRVDRLGLYKAYIDRLMSKKVSLTLSEDDPALISGIISSNRDYRRNLIFEIPLGYNSKNMGRLQKSRLNLSVYVPYGKDWIPYFKNRLAEGRLKNIAASLLNGSRA